MADCPSCGKPVKQGVRYCLACGAVQPGAEWAAPPPQARYAAAQPGVAAPSPHAGRGMPWWGIVLIVLAVGLAVVIPMMLFVMPFVIVDGWLNELVPVLEKQQGASQESAVRSGVGDIQAGIQIWASEHHGEYPAPGRVAGDRLVRRDGTPYVDAWPLNPYTHQPMDQGTGPGQFTYRVEASGRDYRVVGYGEAGKVLITSSRLVPGPTNLPLP